MSVVWVAAAGACASARAPEVFPGVRADGAAHLVEFDAEVIAELRVPDAKLYLEVLACPRDSKEHESLLITRVRPSHVHAALLAAGFQPGSPVTWRTEGGRTVAAPARGDALSVRFVWTDPGTGEERSASPLDWVVHDKTGRRASSLGSGFVFAGSVMVRRPDGTERYDADAAGTLLGLASFGSETIAWAHAFSPESTAEQPVWIADRSAVPPLGTKVIVRVTRPEEEPSRVPSAP